VTYVEKTGMPFEQWFGGFASSRLGALWLRDSEFARGLMAQALPHAQADLKLLEGAIAPTAGVPVKALAYCFCALD
jgi:protease-4